MTLRYALGWWAALVILWGPSQARYTADHATNVTGIFVSLSLITGLSYVLARIGWRLRWFRKPR